MSTELHYRITNPEVLRIATEWELERSEILVYLYLKTLNPFGDRWLECSSKDIQEALKFKAKKTVDRALVRLGALELIEVDLSRFKFKLRTSASSSDVDTEVPIETCKSQNGHTCPEVDTEVPIETCKSQNGHTCPEGIYIERACAQTLQTIQTNSDSLTPSACVRGNSASLSNPSEPVSQTPLTSVLPCQPDLGKEPKHSAPDQGSAAALLQNFSNFANTPAAKCNALFNAGVDACPWEDYPGQPKPELVEWYAKRCPKDAFQPKLTWAKTMLVRHTEATAELWAEFQQLQQRAAAVEEAKAIVPLPAEPSIQQFHQPAEPEVSDRDMIQARINAAIASRQRVNPVTLQRAKELGIDVSTLESPTISASAPEPAIAPVRSTSTFVNPNFELGDWEDTV